MDTIGEMIPTSWDDRRKVLLVVLLLEAVLATGFAITAFIVAQTANAGFNVVLTALVTLGFIGGSFQVIRQSTSPIAIGFLIGSAGTLALLSLTTGIYWSKLSHCNHLEDFVADQYSCHNKAAYTSVSVFAIMLSILELGSSYLVYLWRAELIDEAGRYDEIADNNVPTFNLYQSSPKVFAGELYGQVEERSAEL